METRTGSIVAAAIAVVGLTLLLVTFWNGDERGSSTGSLDLKITDESEDDAKSTEVWSTDVRLHNAEKERIDINFFDEQDDSGSWKIIDELALTGGGTGFLLNSVDQTAGNYDRIRQKVNATHGMIDLGVDRNGWRSLYIPGGKQSGLKLNHVFYRPEDSTTFSDINFDHKKSVHKPFVPEDYYILRQMGERDDGVLSGTVSGVENDPDCNDNMDYLGAVYVFSDGDTVDDIDGIDDPVTSAFVPVDGHYAYTTEYLKEGDYSVVFTCDANIDDSDKDADTDISDGTVEFVGETVVTVVAGTTTIHDFQIPAP